MIESPFPSDVPVIAEPPQKAPLATQLEVFARAVDIGPLALNDELVKGRSKADIASLDAILNTQPRWEHTQQRLRLVRTLATRLVAHVGERRVDAALLTAVRSHPCSSLRLMVGEAIVVHGAPRAALEVMANWIEAPSKYDHWNYMTGAHAVLHQPPAKAYDTLASHLADRQFADRVLGALTQYRGELDPRFFDLATRWLEAAPGEPNASNFLSKYGQRPEVQAALVRAAEERASAKSEPKWGYFYMLLREVKVPGALPALLKIAKRAAKLGDWRFTAPLSAIEELEDPAALPDLRVLSEKLKGKSRSAVLAVITALEKKAPTPAAAPAAKKPAAKAGSPLEQLLVNAGLSGERARSIAAQARNRIEFVPKKASKRVAGETRFGGEPDLPSGAAWPHLTCAKEPQIWDEANLPPPDKKGRFQIPLGFVAQLDLEALAPHDEDGLFPKTGMLWLFARQDVIVGEKWELQQVAAQVIYAKTKGTLVKATPPDTLPERDRHAAATAVISHARRLLPLSAEPMRKLGLIASESAAYEKAAERERGGGTHQSLGWASAAYYRGIPDAKSQVLLAVGSDAVSGFEWGDASRLFFCIPAAALARRDFSKAFCVHDEC